LGSKGGLRCKHGDKGLSGILRTRHSEPPVRFGVRRGRGRISVARLFAALIIPSGSKAGAI
jgi:hypothetical protein